MDPISRQFNLNSVPVSTTVSSETKSGKFAGFMKGMGHIAQTAGKALLPLIPGGNIVGAALRNLGNSDQSFDGIGGGMSPYDMLAIQQQMLQEARVYTLISNVIKIRHDSVMSAIRNIR